MKKQAPVWEKDGYRMRLAQPGDASGYYENNFHPLDPEVARLTGCKPSFSREEVVDAFLQWVEAGDRYHFLILNPAGAIVGESVLNEIDWQARSANFRIGLFHPGDRGKGVGTWAVETTRDFAFGELGLHRLELDVFSFNPRAERAYEKAGFRREGVLRDALWDGKTYADDILMAMLEEEWRELKG